MANTLHFIRERQVFLKRLRSVADRFLIVEYERSKPNRWRPYPVGFEILRQLFSEAGVERVEKLATRPSLFGGTMYSAFAARSRKYAGNYECFFCVRAFISILLSSCYLRGGPQVPSS